QLRAGKAQRCPGASGAGPRSCREPPVARPLVNLAFDGAGRRYLPLSPLVAVTRVATLDTREHLAALRLGPLNLCGVVHRVAGESFDCLCHLPSPITLPMGVLGHSDL